jgi:HEAT repeat protein
MTKGLRRVSWLSVSGALVVLSALSWPVWASAQASKETRQVPVESLIYDLKNPDPVRRREAARLLGENKVQKATPDLVAAAQDPDLEVRREIVIALDKMRDIRALPAFVKLSADQDRLIRDRCIVGLINLYIPQEGGLVVTLNKVANFFNPWSDEWADVVVEPGTKVDASAITALCERLSDTDDGIRLKAARGLGILKGKAAVPSLVAALRQEQTDAVRFETIRSLSKIGDGSAASDLVSFLEYNDNKVRNEAVYAIGRFRYHEAVPEMLKLYEKESALPPKLIDKPYREALLDAMAFIADPSTKALFAKEKQNPDGALRLHAIEGLARLGDPTMATEISRDWLHEKDPRTKTAEAYALFRMGRKEYLDEVVNCLGSGKTNSEARMLLLELKSEELPELYAQVSNNDVNVREGLAEILGLVGDERAIPVLLELGKDRRGQITAIANQAVRRINARIVRQ